MKKSAWGLVLFMIFFAGAVWAAADADVAKKNAVDDALKKHTADAAKPLKEDPFAVSSEDLDPAESLDRISGKIDRGFSSPDQSYKSDDQGAPGPFAREKAEENKKQAGN